MEVTETIELDRTKLGAARLIAAHNFPYFSSPLMSLIPVSKPGLGTFAVDPWFRMYVDPQCVEDWSIEEIASVLVHEVNHLLRRHNDRRIMHGVHDVNHMAWNVAADAEINDDLSGPWPTLQNGGSVVTPASMGWPDGLTAEEYYDLLPKTASEDGQGDEPRDGQGRTVSPNCGSGAHGVPQEGEEGKPSSKDRSGNETKGTSEVPGLSDIEADIVRRMTAQAVVDEASKNRGNVPAGLQRWAESLISPQIPWQRKLRTAINNGIAVVAGNSDTSYRKPSRRQVPNVILPSRINRVPKVSIVVDTSGSMDQKALNLAWAEVMGATRVLGGGRESMKVYACDAAVELVKVQAKANLAGGGGTDMSEGIYVALRDRPDIVIVLTDGYTPWPPAKPRCKLIICIIGDGPEGPEYASNIRIER